MTEPTDQAARSEQAAPNGPEAALQITPAGSPDRVWIGERYAALRGVAPRADEHHPDDLEALVAWRGADRVGHATYRFDLSECELVTLEATTPRQGVGARLLDRVERLARYTGCERVWAQVARDDHETPKFLQARGYSPPSDPGAEPTGLELELRLTRKRARRSAAAMRPGHAGVMAALRQLGDGPPPPGRR